MVLPELSIIIPTFNRSEVLRSVVLQLQEQSFSDFELWLIDQSDEIDERRNRELVDELADGRIRHLFLERRGLPNARNEGLVRVQGRIVLFLDDDVILLSKDFLVAHIKSFQDPSIGAVVGRHVERSLIMNTRKTKCEVSFGGRTLLNLFGTETAIVKSCKGSNMSYLMSAVSEVGGFDRKTNLLEETDFSTRVRANGWKILFQPLAELIHLSTPAGGVRSRDPLSTEKIRFRSTAYFILKHRGILGAIPFCFTFGMIAIRRALEFRSFSPIPSLISSIAEGFDQARKGPDQELPGTLFNRVSSV